MELTLAVLKERIDEEWKRDINHRACESLTWIKNQIRLVTEAIEQRGNDGRT